MEVVKTVALLIVKSTGSVVFSVTDFTVVIIVSSIIGPCFVVNCVLLFRFSSNVVATVVVSLNDVDAVEGFVPFSGFGGLTVSSE